MDVNKLIAVVTIILTLSIASERLVEIIKGFRPKWFPESPPVNKDGIPVTDEKILQEFENRRKARVSILAIVCGMVTAFLASPILASIFKDLFANSACQPLANWSIGLGGISPCGSISLNGFLLTFAMGLLASGGSAMWNSILEYLLKIKDLRKIEVKRADAMRKVDVEKAERLKDAEIDTAERLMNIEVKKAEVDLEVAERRLPKPE